MAGPPMPEDYATMSLQHAVDDTVVLLKKIGPSVVLVHSIGGMVGWKLCETVPDQVVAIIGVAPVPPANMPKDSFPAAFGDRTKLQVEWHGWCRAVPAGG